MYLAYYKHNVMQKDDNLPVGILMCTEAGKELVQYATEGIDENLFVQKYKLNLPSEEKLTEWLKSTRSTLLTRRKSPLSKARCARCRRMAGGGKRVFLTLLK